MESQPGEIPGRSGAQEGGHRIILFKYLRDTIEFVGAEAATPEVQIDAGFRDDWESVAYGFGRLDRSVKHAQLLEEARNSPYISGGSKSEASLEPSWPRDGTAKDGHQILALRVFFVFGNHLTT